ncbi:dethiobiotin synthase [Ignatzschineria cameli]|uniref:ATP-dependent dethiobiotin synthetase BioD n=1 Tax=Ignatzschineria cameli TaxID=2182793 RepID=A0A2U2ATM8_9GAMM|nr:dethiobiotin synthase [Ignatzschineria cameli]PWD88090.1 dethiobiotin synthase [Ignatzschineria cameli]PWD91121.1 dethiobiotin synthase [Ignatzschineria cameli]PWD92762.1 dethiobiotin synthase [Ignatzschineria cameli]PWD93783.1 dethiobiotin synthase [Ignatzschineria cameli]
MSFEAENIKIDEQERLQAERDKHQCYHQCYFITGTDTEIGKTYVSTLLLKALNRQGIRANGYKPVASGAAKTPLGIKNPDAYSLLSASSTQLPYEMVNPYFFPEEEAPHILADKKGQVIDFEVMTRGLAQLREKGDLTLVEGAGGWYTPLSFERSYSDWVIQNRLPVIVVVGLKLGVINHARLTFDAIRAAGLPVIGWVANHLSESSSLPDYIAGIQAFTDIPMIGEIPYQAAQNSDLMAKIDHYFDLKPLLQHS